MESKIFVSAKDIHIHGLHIKSCSCDTCVKVKAFKDELKEETDWELRVK